MTKARHLRAVAGHGKLRESAANGATSSVDSTGRMEQEEGCLGRSARSVCSAEQQKTFYDADAEMMARSNATRTCGGSTGFDLGG